MNMTNGSGMPALPNAQALQQMFMGPLSFFDEQAKMAGANIQNAFNSMNASMQSALSAFQAPFTPRSPSAVQEILTAPGNLIKAAVGVTNAPTPAQPVVMANGSASVTLPTPGQVPSSNVAQRIRPQF